MNTSLADIVTKITSQGKNPDVSFLKDDPKAQTMLLMALLSSVNAKNNVSGQQETDKRKYDSVSSPNNSPSPTRDESESPRRVGRKPVTSDDDDSDNPKSKRKAQNRAAQRAFRERKENHVRVLEERVKELESLNEEKNSKLATENEQLKELVAKLKYENEALLGISASFEYPLSTNSVTSDTNRPNKMIRSSAKEDIYFDTLSSSNISSSSNANTPETQHQLSIDDILGLDTSILPSDALIDHSELLGYNNNDYSGQLNDMLDQHRLSFATNPSDFDFFYPLPSNTDIIDTSSIKLPIEEDKEGEKHVHDIAKVWDRVTQHPRFDEVDMDVLCDEMKKKAVCVDLDLDEEIDKVVNQMYPIQH